MNTQAWNMPNFTMNTSVIYQFDNKLILKADLFALSASKALRADGGVEKLKANVDLNFSANYHLNKNIAFFAQVNNVFINETRKILSTPRIWIFGNWWSYLELLRIKL